MMNIWEYQPGDRIRITCVDGQIIIGSVTDVQDEEESELGEDAINVFVSDGKWIGIGKSEIKCIELLS